MQRRSGLPKHSILGKQFKSALSYASHQGGNETSNAGLNREDTSSVSGPLSRTKVDRATPTSSLNPTYTAPMPPPTTAHVARMSPSTIVHVGPMPSLTTAVAPARDTPPPKTTRGVEMETKVITWNTLTSGTIGTDYTDGSLQQRLPFQHSYEDSPAATASEAL